MVESHLSMKVEVFISARDLKNSDTFSKSDPYCVLSLQTPGATNYSDVGMTEVIQNNLNPNWTKTVDLDYYFEAKQNLKFTVYDYDDSSPDEMGVAFVTLGELVGKGTSFVKLSTKGSLIIRVEEITTTSRDTFLFHMRGIKLDKKDTFGKSDPYLKFYKNVGVDQWVEVHKTEVIKSTLDPVWAPFELTEQHLCDCDRNKPIKVECFDWDNIGSHDLIGIFEATLAQLIIPRTKFQLHNPESQNKPSGIIEVIHIGSLSFIDYLRAGVQLSLSIAIDYTGSNGEYSDSNSLHHLNPSNPNQYERAILEVGTILEAYDNDKQFPVFGFGGVPHGEHNANHCFPLNHNSKNPNVFTIPNVLELYRASLPSIELSGPTLFEKILDSAIKVCKSTPPHAVYYVLLILTDGAIMDMPETIERIVRASGLPLSIIIVGVGYARFDSMEALDSDKGTLTDHSGHTALRDIVQFVPFRNFGGNSAALAAEVLKEVPKQLTDYMKSINYFPVLPEERPISEMVIPIE